MGMLQVSSMSLYVYAIVNRSIRSHSRVFGARSGLRPVGGGGTVAIVADRAEAPSLTESALRDHDAVVRRIARAVPAILPVRFGTLVETDRSLIAQLDAWSADLRAALSLVDRREQMTLRLYGRNVAAEPFEPEEFETKAANNPGTRYLTRLARAQVRSRSAPELAPLRRPLAGIVAAERITRHDAGPLLLTAYHLIPRGKARIYCGILKRHADALGLRAAATGPWPPYAFVPELQP
jgi:hypothetical protein